MPWFMKIGIRYVIELFETNDIKEVVAVRYLPRVKRGGKAFVVFPEKHELLSSFQSAAVRMGGDRNPSLLVDVLHDVLDSQVRAYVLFDIDGQNVVSSRIIRDFGTGDQQHLKFFPGPFCFLP